MFLAHEFAAVNQRIDALKDEVTHVHEEVDLIKEELHHKDDHHAAVEDHHEEEAHHVEDHHHGNFVHRSLKFGPYITYIASKPNAHGVIA